MIDKKIIYLLIYGLALFLGQTDVMAVTAQDAMGFEATHNVWVTEANMLSEFSLSQLLCESVQAGSYETLANGGVSLSSEHIKQGLYSAKWQRHNNWPTMWTRYVDPNWSAYKMLSIWVYSEEATNEEVVIGICSDNAATQWKDFYWQSFTIDWTGWRQLHFPFSSFEIYESVVGWNKIDGIFFTTKIFNHEPNPYTVLYLDDIQLQDCESADLNGDCMIDMKDIAMLASYWLDIDCDIKNWCEKTDLDHSTSTDFKDFALLADAFAGNEISLPNTDTAVIFYAGYDTSLNAQILPPNGSVTPIKRETGSNAIRLTTGNQGYGGGEALLIPDAQDALIYVLDSTYPNTTYMPAHGRLRMKFKITTPMANASIHMFGFNYNYTDYETYARVNMFLTAVSPYGTYATIQGANIFYGGNSNISGTWIPGNPLGTIGWHDLAVEWNRPTPGANQENNVHVSVYVDGQLTIDQQNMCFGRPAAMEALRLGAYFNGNANSIGSQGGLIDRVVIEQIIP